MTTGADAMAERKMSERALFSMTVRQTPFSSVVGQSLTIVDEKAGVVAMLSVSVPQAHLDYRMIAEAVASALTTHGTREGHITLVLPKSWRDAAKEDHRHG